MPAYLIFYTATHERATESLDEFMTALGGVPIGECVWGIEIGLDLQELRKWLSAQLEGSDSVIVFELRPRLAQTSKNLSQNATEWLERVLKPVNE